MIWLPDKKICNKMLYTHFSVNNICSFENNIVVVVGHSSQL